MQSLRARAPRARRTLLVLAACVTTALPATAALAGTAARAPVAAPGASQPGDPGWRVVDAGNGTYRVSWTSPTDLPTGSDRPTITGDALSFGAPTIAHDGRTVTAVVTADSAPVAGELDVVLSGDRLDEAGFDPSTGSSAGQVPDRVTRTLDAADPGEPGPFATVTSDYDWEAVKLPGMPEPIEMVGHVVEPAPDAATGQRPLVLFLHGRHSVCYNPDDDGGGGDDGWPCEAPLEEIPSHLGYDYIQQLLASQGYATVSVRVNGINAQDYRLPDGGADARATIVQEHLDRWVDLAGEHQLDLDRVVLVGHSRGGEGVDRASIQIRPSAPYRIAGQVLLAPTDFAWHTAPYVPTVTVLPYCDGDVYDLQGQRFTDIARDLAPGDTSLKSSVMVTGANHNFFNTEWTPSTAVAPSWDDWGGDPDKTCGRRHPDRLLPREQRAVGQAYVAGAVRLFTGEGDYAPLYDGSPVTVGSVGDADVLSHAIGGGRSMRRPGPDARPTAPSGNADVRLCNGVASWSSGSFAICGRNNEEWVTPHWPMDGEQVPTRKFLEFSWQEQGARGGMHFAQPLDLTSDRLELRTILDQSYGAPALRVRISDSAGGAAVLDPVPGTQPAVLPRVSWATKLWASSVLVDASGATGVDLTDITSVELVSGTAEGRVWVADLASAPGAPPAAPTQRLPQVRIGTVEVDEGSGGPKVARVPFRIVGGVTRPSRLAAFTAGQQRGQTQRLVIDIAPGQTTGSIPIEYEADNVHDFDVETQISLWPIQGLATDDYLGSLVVVDDDPRPTFDVKAPRRVREGNAIEFRVSMEGASDVPVEVAARAVRGPGENLRGLDVPARWLSRQADDSRPRRPLWRLYAGMFEELDPDRGTLTLRFPTRADGRREGREFLYVRLSVDGDSTRYRIKVLDSD